ncbi:hypothetical protein BVC80_441g7 [Macleaya cordata]|uniref:Leucine-rich repeat n=1 Tax=Macleaya cordata TaxID=56857 RepID=A0A200Q488_MACCD|nr:hypothetical protein BVC80_441g7 [Macleaya cordata]
MVLEGLKPHPNLKWLEINRFMGLNLPTWLMSNVSLSVPNLIEIRLVNCDRCQKLPALGQLPFLRILYIEQMNAVKRLSYEFYGLETGTTTTTTDTSKKAITAFPSLKKLTLKRMLNLKEWVEPPALLFSYSFPCLEELIIKSCPRLTTLPILFPSLIKDDEMLNSNDMAVRSMMRSNNLTSLNYLEIRIGLTYLPQELLQNNDHLQSLVIWDCPLFQGFLSSMEEDEEVLQEQVSNPHLKNSSKSISLEPTEISDYPLQTIVPEVQGLTSLRSLTIGYCKELKSIPEDLLCLTSLKEMEIGYLSDELNSFLFPNENEDENKSSNIQDRFISLQSLKINGLSKLKSLPEQLKQFTKLKELEISNMENIVALPDWLGDLSELRSLQINNCHSLMYLPYVDGMQRLTALEKLTLCGISKELDLFPAEGIQHLISLRQLEIHGWSKLNYLPHQLQYLKNLEVLSIRNFHGLVALPEWLGNFSSLQQLEIWYCKNLMHLPSKEVMQCLTALRCLFINSCPLLKKQCSTKSGSEWYKISHVKFIEIW